MSPTDLLVRTRRLDLIPATLEHLDAELRGHSALEELLHATVPDDWPPGEYDRNAQKFFRDKLAADGPSLVGWLTWYAMTRHASGSRDTLVAGAGFLGPPVEGVVEIGYSVIPAARGRGYASEIVSALTAFAFEHDAVDEVIAHTSDENVASTRVLRRCGFRRVGPGPDAGSVEYRLRREPGGRESE